ncbi:MAG: PAS domain S-box protein, partial [Candidatus Bathyarchaeota archaeon]
DAIAVTGLDGNIVECNQATLDMLSYFKEELIGKSAFDLVAPEYRQRTKENFEKILKEGTIKNVECPLLTKDSEEFPTELSASTIQDAHGETTSVVFTAKNITERKRMEDKLKHYSAHLEEMVEERTKKLQESEEKFRGLVERSFDAIVAFDLEGRILYASPAIENIGGRKIEEFTGKPFWSYLPESEVPNILQAITEVVEGKTTISLELNILKKDGALATVETRGSPIVKDGKVVGVQAIFRDITERKKLEEQSKEIDKLNVMGNVAVAIAHDIRNPLQAMRSAAFLLKESRGKTRQDILNLLDHNIAYSDRILRNLIDFAASHPLDLKEVDVNYLLEQTLIQLVFPKTVKISKHYGDIPEVSLDNNQISHAFTNLVLNAVQSIPDGSSGILNISTNKTGNFVEVKIKDTGVGIAEENLEKIFDPFFTTKSKGSGLGLPSAKKIVEAHNGTIHVESKEGEGTIVTIQLPTKPENKIS